MITELKKRSADAPQLTAGLHPDALRAENAVDVLNLPDTIARLHGSRWHWVLSPREREAENRHSLGCPASPRVQCSEPRSHFLGAFCPGLAAFTAPQTLPVRRFVQV